MSKELRVKVSDSLHAEITAYVQRKKRAGEMFRTELASFLRDAIRDKLDRHPFEKGSPIRGRGRPPKENRAELPELSGANPEADRHAS